MASRGTLSFNNVMVSTDTGTVYHGLHIILTESAIEIRKDDSIILSITLSSVIAIEVHQPIFGSNYIEIEHGDHCKTVLTFKGGGATEFAQAFFRRTEGRLETSAVDSNRSAHPPHHGNDDHSSIDKKNK